jgi:chloramphenicol O-acetyltransferase type A
MGRMASPQLIDVGAWPRYAQFQHYLHSVACTYAMTVELDVTDFVDALADSTRKTYIAQIWALATVVNRHAEFRMCLAEGGAPATWDVVHPSFTIFNAARETFSSVWTPYDTDFGVFHDAAAAVLDEHRETTEFFPQGAPPPNSFDVSSLPWASFTGFTLDIRDGWEHLAPIFTLGRYVQREGRMLLPLAIQIHHAAADGFHTSRLVNELQELVADPSWIG